MKIKNIILLSITALLVVSVFYLFSQNKALAGPAAGWVSPTGFEDPDSDWWDEPWAYDDDETTYASNNWNVGWGGFLVLTLNTPLYSNKIRVKADYMAVDIQEVDIDVYIDRGAGYAWENVYNGSIENVKWDIKSFPAGVGWITKARFRYNYITGGSGWSYWLYEFDFYETQPAISVPTCETLNATSVEETTAILHGRVIDDGGELSEFRFQYRKLGSGDPWIDTPWQDSKATGEGVTRVISGLDKYYTYEFRVQVRNSAGTCDGNEMTFFTEPILGWVSPTGYEDPDNAWEYEENAYDDDTATYARDHHNIDEPVWSSYLILTHQEIKSDKIRFWARRGSEVDSVDIDIYIDRGAGYAWEDVYEGDFANKTWVEKNFTGGEGLVDKARIRFHATSAKNGFFWELYEFNFFKTGLLYPNPATTPGILISTNLLEDQPLPIESVESFNYTASSKPADTTLRVQFSQDNVNWYNSAGVLGEWDILNEGFHSIDLSGLGWFGNNFYYKMEFYSNPQRDATPVLDEISVSFIMHYPIEACLSANPIRTITCEYRKVACEEDETTVCSISKDTSAHVGNKDKYGNVGEPGFKVCCKLSL